VTDPVSIFVLGFKSEEQGGSRIKSGMTGSVAGTTGFWVPDPSCRTPIRYRDDGFRGRDDGGCPA